MYDKSDLIKATFVTALNKKYQFMVQSVILIKKTEDEICKILTPEEILKFYVNKDTTKNLLSFQLTSVSGKLPKLKNKKNLPYFN